MWHMEDRRRRVLLSCFNKVKHACNNLPTPITVEDLKLSLRQSNFEEFLPKSKNWTSGYFKSHDGNSLFVLLRKNGVDLGLHGRTISLQPDASGYVSASSYNLTHRYTYDEEIKHVNELVIQKVSTLFDGGCIMY